MTVVTRARVGSMIRPAPEADAAIVLRAVNKSFGATRAVKDFDLVVPRGSLCGFLGPNGAGKSTTIRMLMSIIYPDTGEVRVLGSSALDSKDRIGYLPEERGLYRTMRVAEFLTYMARLKGVDGAAASRGALEWLERIELANVAKKKCQELSKGMQQKVQFVAAVLHDPELLILDEPFSGLDPVNSRLLIGLITELHSQGRTIIFSTHQMHTAQAMCDRIVLINRGDKLLDASLHEVLEHFDPRTLSIEPMRRDDDLSEELRRLTGVVSVDRVDEVYEVHVDRAADPHETMRAAMSMGPLRSVALRRTSLDDVFVELVTASGGTAPPTAAATTSSPSAPRKESVRG